MGNCLNQKLAERHLYELAKEDGSQEVASTVKDEKLQ